MEFSVNHPVLYVIVGAIIALVMAQSVFFLVKSVKKARKQTVSFLTMLLSSPLTLDEMMQYGSVEFRISPDGECKPMKDF